MEVQARDCKRVRVLIAILGLDQHETGALAVTAMLRDAGMEVIYLGRFASPESIAVAAVEESADVVGISCHSWEYIHYLDDLLRGLEQEGKRIPLVIGGSVISPSDRARLLEKGVSAVFGAGTTSDDIVATVRSSPSRPPTEAGHFAPPTLRSRRIGLSYAIRNRMRLL